MEKFTIGTLSTLTGISVDTIRYYEQIGLLPKAMRKDSGYRMFCVDDVRMINFIKKAKLLGFSLREIDELLKLKVDADTTCDDIRRKAEKKLIKVENKLNELKTIKSTLMELISQCAKNLSGGECPILDAFDTVDNGRS